MIEKRPSGMPRSVFFEYKFHNRFAIPEWSPINFPYCSEQEMTTVFNCLASGNLWQYTNLPTQETETNNDGAGQSILVSQKGLLF